MGLEDERKMLTGSGDPKEVRRDGRLDRLHCAAAQQVARQNPPGARLALVGPWSLQGQESWFPGPFPRILRVTLGE